MTWIARVDEQYTSCCSHPRKMQLPLQVLQVLRVLRVLRVLQVLQMLQVLQVLQVPGTRWVCSYSRGSPQNSRAGAPLWEVHWGHDHQVAPFGHQMHQARPWTSGSLPLAHSAAHILHGSCSRSKGDLSRLQRTRPRGCVRGARLSSASEPPNAHRSPDAGHTGCTADTPHAARGFESR